MFNRQSSCCDATRLSRSQRNEAPLPLPPRPVLSLSLSVALVRLLPVRLFAGRRQIEPSVIGRRLAPVGTASLRRLPPPPPSVAICSNDLSSANCSKRATSELSCGAAAAANEISAQIRLLIRADRRKKKLANSAPPTRETMCTSCYSFFYRAQLLAAKRA